MLSQRGYMSQSQQTSLLCGTLPPAWPSLLSLLLPSGTQFCFNCKPQPTSTSRPRYWFLHQPLLQQVTNSSDNWIISGIPANQHRLTLTRLDPGSLYEVEMAAYNCAGEGQTAMVTFRTGKDQTLPPA